MPMTQADAEQRKMMRRTYDKRALQKLAFPGRIVGDVIRANTRPAGGPTGDESLVPEVGVEPTRF
jgi:hypothetical protein